MNVGTEADTKVSNFQASYARTLAFMEGLHDAKTGRTPPTTYERLRERYAHGKISLGQFEAEVTVLLQSAA